MSIDEAYVTSPYVYARWVEGKIVIGSVHSTRMMRVGHPAVLLALAAFAQPRRREEGLQAVLEQTGHAESAALEAFVERLIELGFLLSAADGSRADHGWEFHDALFHLHSRHGRGASSWLGTGEPPPVVQELEAEEIVPLPPPASPALAVPLGEVLEARRSVRDLAAGPVGLDALGTLLAASGRVQRQQEYTLTDGTVYPISWRPYPSGGACHPLEVYPVVAPGGVEGVAPGVYHYCPEQHHLGRLGAPDERSQRLLTEAHMRAQLAADPPVLLCVTARFERTRGKYLGVAYSLVLKELGGWMQTVYLVATALGLAPCAVGAGPFSVLAEILGRDELTEPQIGEMVIGVPRGGEPAADVG